MNELPKRGLVLFALIFPSAAVFTYFLGDPSATRLWYASSKLLQFALPLAGTLFPGMERRWDLKGGVTEAWRGAATGLAIFASLGLLYWFLLRQLGFIGEVRIAVTEKLRDFGVTGFGDFLALAAFISVLHSFLEEYYWRGFVFAELRERWGRRLAYPLAALGFTGHHVVVIARYVPASQAWLLVPLFSSFVFVAGLAWAFHYERRRSLLGAWLSHFLADSVIMAAGAHLVFGAAP
jgi:uncharacterized protein